jgi:hypothetical protein
MLLRVVPSFSKTLFLLLCSIATKCRNFGCITIQKPMLQNLSRSLTNRWPNFRQIYIKALKVLNILKNSFFIPFSKVALFLNPLIWLQFSCRQVTNQAQGSFYRIFSLLWPKLLERVGNSVAEPHHFDAAPGLNFDAAPAAPAPAPTLLYSKANNQMMRLRLRYTSWQQYFCYHDQHAEKLC